MKTLFYPKIFNNTFWLFLSLTLFTISIQAQNETCLLFDGGDQLSTFEPQDPNQETRQIAVFNEIGAGDFTIEFNINSDGPGNQVEAVISNRSCVKHIAQNCYI